MTVTEVLDSIQYLVNEDGERTAAVIQIHAWQQLMPLLDFLSFAPLSEVENDRTPQQIVADVQARPPDPAAVIKPEGSLLDALQNPTYENEDFDLDEWTKQWSAIERQMKAVSYQNDVAEGRA